jgi:hypothetical protein
MLDCDPNGHSNGTGPSPAPILPCALIRGANQPMVVGPCRTVHIKRVDYRGHK